MHFSFTLGLIPCQFRTAHRFGQICSFHAIEPAVWLCDHISPGAYLPSAVPAWHCASLLRPLVDTEQTARFCGNNLCAVAGLGREQCEPARVTRG